MMLFTRLLDSLAIESIRGGGIYVGAREPELLAPGSAGVWGGSGDCAHLQAPAEGSPRHHGYGRRPSPADSHARGDDRGDRDAWLQQHERQARDRPRGRLAPSVLRAVREQGRLLPGDLRPDRASRDQTHQSRISDDRGRYRGAHAGRVRGVRGRSAEELEGAAPRRDRRPDRRPRRRTATAPHHRDVRRAAVEQLRRSA